MIVQLHFRMSFINVEGKWQQNLNQETDRTGNRIYARFLRQYPNSLAASRLMIYIRTFHIHALIHVCNLFILNARNLLIKRFW